MGHNSCQQLPINLLLLLFILCIKIELFKRSYIFQSLLQCNLITLCILYILLMLFVNSANTWVATLKCYRENLKTFVVNLLWLSLSFHICIAPDICWKHDKFMCALFIGDSEAGKVDDRLPNLQVKGAKMADIVGYRVASITPIDRRLTATALSAIRPSSIRITVLLLALTSIPHFTAISSSLFFVIHIWQRPTLTCTSEIDVFTFMVWTCYTFT